MDIVKGLIIVGGVKILIIEFVRSRLEIVLLIKLVWFKVDLLL